MTRGEQKQLAIRIKIIREYIAQGAFQSASMAAENLAANLAILSDKYQISMDHIVESTSLKGERK